MCCSSNRLRDARWVADQEVIDENESPPFSFRAGKYAKADGIVSADPFSSLPRSVIRKARKRERSVYTREEVSTLIGDPRNPPSIHVHLSMLFTSVFAKARAAVVDGAIGTDKRNRSAA